MQATTDKYILYYHTGCSSCVRTKEFLVQSGVDFVAIDTLQNPEGYEQLLRLGVRYVPVVTKGTRYVRGQNLEDVAAFLACTAASGCCCLPRSWSVNGSRSYAAHATTSAAFPTIASIRTRIPTAIGRYAW